MGKYAIYDEGKKRALLEEITASVGDKKPAKKVTERGREGGREGERGRDESVFRRSSGI